MSAGVVADVVAARRLKLLTFRYSFNMSSSRRSSLSGTSSDRTRIFSGMCLCVQRESIGYKRSLSFHNLLN